MILGLFHSPPCNAISRREYPLDSLLSWRVHRQVICVVRTAIGRYVVLSAGVQAIATRRQEATRTANTKRYSKPSVSERLFGYAVSGARQFRVSNACAQDGIPDSHLCNPPQSVAFGSAGHTHSP